MKILFIAKHKWPSIGGVERHVRAVGDRLQGIGYRVNTISEEDIKQPKIKIIGLLYIWYWLFKNRKLITGCNLVHIHDVFIWYLPFRFLYPKKKVFITFHGWEGKWPIPMWNILNKKLASFLCNGSIAVGNYIEKWYGVKSNYVIYGGITRLRKTSARQAKNTIVWLGRQDEDTGIKEFRQWLMVNGQSLKVTYVTNVKNPEKYLKTAEYCVPSGYLSYLEAKSYGCKILTFANNPLKEDYWKEVKSLKKIPTWDEVTEVYRKLWEKK
ncbi:MAG: glycosyltransferase [Patescibacteria group bacterium]